MVLRRIFEPKREEVAGGWRRWHKEENRILQASTDIVRAIKLRMMGREKHVVRMGDMRNLYKILI